MDLSKVTRPQLHRYIYLLGLAGYIFSIPTSRFVLSLATMLLAANWLAEGQWSYRWERFKKHWHIISLPLLFGLLALSLLYSQDVGFGLKQLRVKIPLLALPIIIGTSKPLRFEELRYICYFYLSAVFIGTVIGAVNYFDITAVGEGDVRKIYPVVSHIRFSLMTLLAAFLSLYFFTYEPYRLLRVALLALGIWFLIFMFIQQSLTGLVILGASLVVVLFVFISKSKRPVLRWIMGVGLSIPLIYLVAVTSKEARYFIAPTEFSEEVAKASPSGSPYFHDSTNALLENGHRVWVNIEFDEIRRTWNERSDIPIEGKDKSGQPIEATLLRFLASKGVEKNAETVKALTAKEIKAIENGETNVRFIRGEGLSERIYKAFWELDAYTKGANPSSNPLAARLVFWKAGWNIFKDNVWFGVGAGDLNVAFDNYYDKHTTSLDASSRHRGHNQYLTFFITLGLFLGTFACILWFVPLFVGRPSLLFGFVLLLIGLSFINEDVLDTQFGVSFTVFFYSLFLWGWDGQHPPRIFGTRQSAE